MKSFKMWILQYVGEKTDLGRLACEVVGDKNSPATSKFEKNFNYIENNWRNDLDLFLDAWVLYVKEVWMGWY